MSLIDRVLKASGAGLGVFVGTFLGDSSARGSNLIESDRDKSRNRKDQDQDNGQQPNAKAGGRLS